jgi:hypothetical protein
MVQNSSGQTAQERDRGGSKERKGIFACDEVENVATQSGVITLTETHRTGGVLLAAPQIRVQSEPDATTTSNDNIPEQSAASGLHAYTDQAGQTIFVTETDEQTPFFDMNREQFDSIFLVKEYASVILYQVMLPPCTVFLLHDY